MITRSTAEVLALDAMGVIFKVGDDVADVLVPFIRERGGAGDLAQVDVAYTEASLGRISAEEFWRRVDIAPELEDEYLAQLEITPDLHDFLGSASRSYGRIVCLSNDLGVWSKKLRAKFDLERHISGWYISGDVGSRKPGPEIYRYMLTDLDVPAQQVVFVDDRLKNLKAAAELGIQTVYFSAQSSDAVHGHRQISQLSELLRT